MQTPTSFQPAVAAAAAASSSASASRRKCPIHDEGSKQQAGHQTMSAALPSLHQHKHNNNHNHHHHHDHLSKFHSTSSRGSSSSPSDSDPDHEISAFSEPGYQFPEADIIEEKVYIALKTGQSLGCSVVRGPSAYPGIFVQDVKGSSASASAGLEIGDQILAMNGFSFYPGHYNFDDAINKIKACTQMTLTVRKRVGLHLFRDLKRKNNVHKIRAVVHSSQENDSDYDPEKDFDLTGICGIHGTETEVKQLSDHVTTKGVVNGKNTFAPQDILMKVRMEEERLAEDRRILAAEQIKLQQEMQRLAIERYDFVTDHTNDKDRKWRQQENTRILRNMITFVILTKISLLSLGILLWCLFSPRLLFVL